MNRTEPELYKLGSIPITWYNTAEYKPSMAKATCQTNVKIVYTCDLTLHLSTAYYVVNQKATWPTDSFLRSYHMCHIRHPNSNMLLQQLQRCCHSSATISTSCMAYIETRLSINLNVLYRTLWPLPRDTVRYRTVCESCFMLFAKP